MLNRMLYLCLTAWVVVASTATAENWAQWRGPNFNGSSTETGLPSTWTKPDAVWSLDMPGPSAATPIIFGDKVFAPTIDKSAQTLHAMCIDRKTGKVLWNKQEGEGAK